MKLFIWEGDSISPGYHDDGTLIVLAHDVDSARTLAIASAPEPADEYDQPWDKIENPSAVWRDGHRPIYLERDKTCLESVMRDPDRIVDLDTPRVVSFNGGGYD